MKRTFFTPAFAAFVYGFPASPVPQPMLSSNLSTIETIYPRQVRVPYAIAQISAPPTPNFPNSNIFDSSECTGEITYSLTYTDRLNNRHTLTDQRCQPNANGQPTCIDSYQGYYDQTVAWCVDEGHDLTYALLPSDSGDSFNSEPEGGYETDSSTDTFAVKITGPQSRTVFPASRIRIRAAYTLYVGTIGSFQLHTTKICVGVVHLIVYNRHPFKAHWGLFVPHENDPTTGTVIHAAGDVHSGFHHEFKRNYCPGVTHRKHETLLVAFIPGGYVSDSKGDGQQVTEYTARDHIENLALSVPTPDPGMNSTSNPPPGGRVQLKDCQSWIQSYVAQLVSMGIMTSDANQTVMSAPMH